MLLVTAAVAGLWLLRAPAAEAAERGPIVIGALHAQNGPLAAAEAPLLAALRLAVDEINRDGGLLGRRVELQVEDTGGNDASAVAAAARRLIVEQHAVALFGCATFTCRQAARTIVEAQQHLLFYPLAYEGLERSPHVVYMGAVPNQRQLPAADWAMSGFGRRVFLLGSDGTYSRRMHAVMREFVPLSGGRVLGERQLPAGASGMGALVADLRRLQPDLVLSTLGGESNRALFDALVTADLAELPLLSFAVGEPEFKAYGAGRLGRHFTAASYLQALPGAANQAFMAGLRRYQGSEACEAAVSSHAAVKLWAAAVREVGDAQPAAVGANVLQQSALAPQGPTALDGQSRHLWHSLRMAQVQPDGRLAEVWHDPRQIRPMPWPVFRTHDQWRAIVDPQGGLR
ncbi:transporter substrate-binding protein [Roseateles sp. LKC17W]